MKYNHIVKVNGIFYPAGAEIPEQDKVEEIVPSDSDIMLETDIHKYTKEELSEMTVKDIRKIAEDSGIEITKIIKNDVIDEFLKKQK